MVIWKMTGVILRIGREEEIIYFHRGFNMEHTGVQDRVGFGYLPFCVSNWLEIIEPTFGNLSRIHLMRL